MADPKTTTKQYVVIAPAGGANVRSGAANPRRRYFEIQNTGSANGLFSWDVSTVGAGDGGAFELLPGQSMKWDRWCPIQAANFSSTGGTTFAVAEGTLTDG